MKKILYLLFLITTGSYSQNQAANWYFGDNAGINFNSNTGAVTSLTNGQLRTDEGCTSISNENGELLFYTDGITVYNRLHQQMNNGNNLFGNPSSAQSAIIIPKPEDTNIYYIFTQGTSFQNQQDQGFNYSEVDMTLDGGLGGVIAATKNTRLRDENNNTYIATEKLSAVLKDCESGNILVTTLVNDLGTNDLFYVYEVSSSGITLAGQPSNANVTTTGNGRGYLKFSPDGTKLVSANIRDGLYLYDFDVTTGSVSLQQQIAINATNLNGAVYPYGVEFSSNSQVLYVSTYNDFFSQDQTQNNDPNNHNSALLQYDLSATDINASQMIIESKLGYRSALQLAPDSKIYKTESSTYDRGLPNLSTIESPNIIGLDCDYMLNTISLNGRNARQGLPPFISSFFTEKIDIIGNTSQTIRLSLCDGETYTLIAENITGANYFWTQDGVAIPTQNPINELIINTDNSNTNGNYEVLIEIPGNDCETKEGQAIVTYVPNPDAFNASLFQCDEDGTIDGRTIFNLTEAEDVLTGGVTNVSVTFYTSSADAIDEDNEIDATNFPNTSNPQIVYAVVKDNATECTTIAELTLDVSTTQIADYSAEAVCDELGSEDGINTFNLNDFTSDIQSINGIAFPITYYENYSDALLEQNELTSPYTNTTPYSQTIFARAEDNNACYGISEVTITINTLPAFTEDETVLYCLNYFPETITLESGVIGNPDDFTYLWSNGETTNQILINAIGNYSVIATNANGCEKSRTIIVEPSNIATIDSIEVIDAVSNNTITVNAFGEGEYEYALFNDAGLYAYYQTSNIFTNVAPGGIYTVLVKDIKNDCGIVQEIVSVIGFPKFFTPNNDGVNDFWQVFGVSSLFQPNTKIKIFDRFGKLLKQISPIGQGWDGTFNGEILPSDDYWFAVTLQDGREYFNHFTLKR